MQQSCSKIQIQTHLKSKWVSFAGYFFCCDFWFHLFFFSCLKKKISVSLYIQHQQTYVLLFNAFKTTIQYYGMACNKLPLNQNKFWSLVFVASSVRDEWTVFFFFFFFLLLLLFGCRMGSREVRKKQLLCAFWTNCPYVLNPFSRQKQSKAAKKKRIMFPARSSSTLNVVTKVFFCSFLQSCGNTRKTKYIH